MGRRRFHFSLRSIFVVTAIVAVICAVVAYRDKSRRDRVAHENLTGKLDISNILRSKTFGLKCMLLSRGNGGGPSADCITHSRSIGVWTEDETLDNLTDRLEEDLLGRLASAGAIVSDGPSDTLRRRHGRSMVFYYRGAKAVFTFYFTPVDSDDWVWREEADYELHWSIVMFR